MCVDTAGRVLELAQLLVRLHFRVFDSHESCFMFSLQDTMWRTADSGLMAYSLALLNNVSYNVLEFAKSQVHLALESCISHCDVLSLNCSPDFQVEWMSEKIIKAFEDQRNNPFQFKHLVLCHSLTELQNVPSPKVGPTLFLSTRNIILGSADIGKSCSID